MSVAETAALELLLETPPRLEFEDRENIVSYNESVNTAIDEFIAAIEFDGGTPWQSLGSTVRHQLLTSLNSPYGEYRTEPMQTAELPLAMVERIGEACFPPIGYDHCEVLEDGDIASLIWADADNGGYIWVTVKRGSHTGLTATSGKRPLL